MTTAQRAPMWLRLACAALALIGAVPPARLLQNDEIVRLVDLDGALSVSVLAVAGLALASQRRWALGITVVLLLGASSILAAPLLGTVVLPGDFDERAPFVALCLLAAVAVGLRMVERPLAAWASASVAGLALAAIVARWMSALVGDPGNAALWPDPSLFIAPFSMLPLLAWPVWPAAKAAGGRLYAVAMLAMLASLGAGLMALLGYLLGSSLLMVGIGANSLPIQNVFALLVGLLFLRAVLDRTPARFVLGLALLGFAAAGLASIALPSLGAMLRGTLLPPDGAQAGRLLIGSAYFALLTLAGFAIAAPRVSSWLLRLAQLAALSALVGALVLTSGMIAEALYGVDPILGASTVSFLGVYSLGTSGVALLCGATRRTSVHCARTEAVPATVAAVAVALTISLWGGATRQSADAIAATGDVALEAMSRTLAAELESREMDFGRLAGQLATDAPEARRARVAAAGRALAQRYPALARLAWVGDDGDFVSNSVPRAGINLAPAYEWSGLTAIERRLLSTAGRPNSAAFAAAPPSDGLPLQVALAARIDGAGSLVALFVLGESDLTGMVGNPVPGYGAAIEVDGVSFGMIGASSKPVDDLGKDYLRQRLRMMSGVSAQIEVWPLPDTVDRLRSRLPGAILVAGLMISALLWLVVALAGAARDRAQRALAAQLAAESSRREIAELLEGLPDAFFAYNRDWRCTHVNRAAEKLIVGSRERMLGAVIWDLSERTLRDFGVPFQRAMNERTIERFEVFFEPMKVWISVQAFPLPEGIGAVARDITREREALEDLRRSEASLAQALEIADLARLEVDTAGRVTWSGAATRVLGCALEDLPTDRAAARRLWHPDEAPMLTTMVDEGIRSGRGYDVEHRLTWPDGSVRWVHSVGRVLGDSPGGPRVVATVQDITERRLQARAVMERDRFFEGSRDLFCIVSRDGRFVQVNPALCRALGVARDALIGRSVFDFNFEEDRDASRKRFADALSGVHESPSVFRIRSADGSIRSIHWTSSGSPNGDLYTVGHDVTDRMTAEAERERNLAVLRVRNEELQQFAYIASHDLQEPLRKIQAFGDRLRTRFAEVLDADGRDYLTRMDSAAQRMSELIADVLDYSRVSTRGEPFAVVPLSDALADALGDLEESIRVAGATVDAAPLPAIEGDRRQLAQVFQNLVGNAVKYRDPQRAPRVRIVSERFDEPLANAPAAPVPWVRVLVSDNGIGFEPAHGERIFAPFQRLHGRGEYAGTGIGLAIVRKIVERHGGRVRAEGAPGEGARFIVELPMRHPAPVQGA